MIFYTLCDGLDIIPRSNAFGLITKSLQQEKSFHNL